MMTVMDALARYYVYSSGMFLGLMESILNIQVEPYEK